MKLMFLILVCVMLGSCHDEYSICEQNTEVRLRAGLYTITGGQEQPSTVPLFTISVLGSGTPILIQQPGVSKFLIDLNPVLSSNQYRILIDQNISDTLTLTYSTQTLTISDVCPDVYVHILTGSTTTTHYIDSVKIINPQVTISLLENLKIYH